MRFAIQLFLSSLLLGAVSGFAQTVTVGSATGSPGAIATPSPIPVSFVRDPANPIADYVFRISFDNSRLVISAKGVNGGACAVNDSLGLVVVLPIKGQSDLASATYCNLIVNIREDTPLGVVNLDLFSEFPGAGCVDNAAMPVTCNLVDGTITIVGEPATVPVAVPTNGKYLIGLAALLVLLGINALRVRP